MNSKVFFQLIRWKNLVLGIATLVLIKYYLTPIFVENSRLSLLNFILLTLGITLISAGGYIYNDIVDIKADHINKPENVYIGTYISEKTAYKVSFIFFLIGNLLGIISAINNNSSNLTIYFFGLALSLVFYSKYLKSIALIGNLVVALVISSSIFVIPIFEKMEFSSIEFQLISGYALFAFLINFMRELIKDIEDVNGDFKLNYATLPIIIGVKRTRNITIGISIILYINLVFLLFQIKGFNEYLFYYSMIVILPTMLYFMYKLYNAKTKKDYSNSSLILKLIMLLGILSIFTF
ncbi:geranylgeranylglycerol-phosphate geranylgeranyltransferase [Urechidicola vernalis]|uniref:Geranylgeranylglycerol-phosphate geranylgeranyltransferase n=1 Tax=Urechidicola vernalis TaxID=3075600 RepID=A0ABU2Y0I4_9FLAO|nr:geranylgeranylglycerol-phosphate geranylgeranyltransferase [Urechidicola sp. P050]MDT0551674.1 geranylgeranylglycerol-phosphate geranylgeranyltransferase [Urechidicola sp. P050]